MFVYGSEARFPGLYGTQASPNTTRTNQGTSDLERRSLDTTPGATTTARTQSQGPAPATIVVFLPADARLTIDDTPTRSTSNLRAFVTPPLEPGKVYHYTLRAESIRDGRPISVTTE